MSLILLPCWLSYQINVQYQISIQGDIFCHPVRNFTNKNPKNWPKTYLISLYRVNFWPKINSRTCTFIKDLRVYLGSLQPRIFILHLKENVCVWCYHLFQVIRVKIHYIMSWNICYKPNTFLFESQQYHIIFSYI